MSTDAPLEAALSDQLRSYLALRREHQELFPGLFVVIRDAVEAELAEFGARGVVGELDREAALRRDPNAGLGTPYDWVAFGFAGYEFYDAHVGVVLHTREWPCTCHVGFHRRAHLPAATHARIETIDWVAAVGAEPEHELTEATQEHQLRDPARAFDFSTIESETAHFTARACAYYRAAVPVLGHKRA